MKTPYGHLTYCSNIHPGEKWNDHFAALKETVPYIRQQLAPGQPFGLGLRIANDASLELIQPECLAEFKTWLAEHDLYVFVINGFPYGGFHNTHVKDQVHKPDWTTTDRTEYTIRLFDILAQLLPEGMEGGVSTPPLSYRLWWPSKPALTETIQQAIAHILKVTDHLIELSAVTGKTLHLDIEPEPDGILDTIGDFITWYTDDFLPEGIRYLTERYGFTDSEAREKLLTHVRLCYDICHAAVAYENPRQLVNNLKEAGIKIGRIQVSSALKVDFSDQPLQKYKAIKAFDEPVYLHQVIEKTVSGEKKSYPDLPQALENWDEGESAEWRVHFHVPLFIQSYGVLESTQNDIIQTLKIQKQTQFSPYMEVETYTWGVLPAAMQKPIGDSIVREIKWVQNLLETPEN